MSTRTELKVGTMAYLRAWYGDKMKRGTVVHLDGREGKFWITSAGSLGGVRVRSWETGKLETVDPMELVFS